MASAKKSRIETLHNMFIETLITALQAGDQPASVLSVIRATLADAKVQPAITGDDRIERMKSMYTQLPFTDTTEDGIPTTNEKAKH
jgi:hypothetical protein